MAGRPEPDPSERRRAAAIAGHAGDVDGARRAAIDEDASVRATGLGALARLGVLLEDDLQRALADDAASVRARAAELVPLLDATGAAGELRLAPLLLDQDHVVVETAAFASGERSPSEVGIVELLSSVTVDHPDPLCREAAVAALGAIGDRDGLAAILAATKDKPAVRRRAVLALAPFEGEEVDEALHLALADRDWQVRQAAEDLLDVPPDAGVEEAPDEAPG